MRAMDPRLTTLGLRALGWRFEVVDLDGRRIDKVLAISLNQRAGATVVP